MIKGSEFSAVRLGRRDVLHAAAAAALGMPLIGTRAFGQDKLSGSGEVVVFSYGGSYTKAMRKNVYEPFTKATGIAVVDVTADSAEPQVKAMKQGGRVDWDVAVIDVQYFNPMREAGMFVPIDYSIWDDESLKGVPQEARFSDGVVAYQNAVVLVYDERAFPSGGPKDWVDFWNLKAFPGPRGLAAKPTHLTFPLVADGVPESQIWPLTDDKLDRAFRKLDEIKPNVAKWWSAGGEPIQALLNKEFAVTTCFDGRAVQAIRHGASLRIVWNQGQIGGSYYTILRGGPNSGNAQKFLAYVNRAQIAANYTLETNLVSPNSNQLQHLPANIIPLLSINPENKSQLTPLDGAWLSSRRTDGKTNFEHVQERWLAWRAQG